ncbi:MAG: hypothetical protein OXU20_37220 [Myxococcales bacterium]|nr:hypothetical protein [Myxococcales bacterium]MDD9965671.1 hypothetical protein [Myxococcales bacterium]
MPAPDAEPLAAPSESPEPCWKRFQALLAREQEAATQADVEALVSLQVAKRQLLDELRSADVPEAVLLAMHKQAQFNVSLMRHLTGCLAGMVGEDGSGPTGTTYDARGQRGASSEQPSLAPRVRGAL